MTNENEKEETVKISREEVEIVEGNVVERDIDWSFLDGSCVGVDAYFKIVEASEKEVEIRTIPALIVSKNMTSATYEGESVAFEAGEEIDTSNQWNWGDSRLAKIESPA